MKKPTWIFQGNLLEACQGLSFNCKFFSWWFSIWLILRKLKLLFFCFTNVICKCRLYRYTSILLVVLCKMIPEAIHFLNRILWVFSIFFPGFENKDQGKIAGNWCRHASLHIVDKGQIKPIVEVGDWRKIRWLKKVTARRHDSGQMMACQKIVMDCPFSIYIKSFGRSCLFFLRDYHLLHSMQTLLRNWWRFCLHLNVTFLCMNKVLY